MQMSMHQQLQDAYSQATTHVSSNTNQHAKTLTSM